jgi:hypothetical protein
MIALYCEIHKKHIDRPTLCLYIYRAVKHSNYHSWNSSDVLQPKANENAKDQMFSSNVTFYWIFLISFMGYWEC